MLHKEEQFVPGGCKRHFGCPEAVDFIDIAAESSVFGHKWLQLRVVRVKHIAAPSDYPIQ